MNHYFIITQACVRQLLHDLVLMNSFMLVLKKGLEIFKTKIIYFFFPSNTLQQQLKQWYYLAQVCWTGTASGLP